MPRFLFTNPVTNRNITLQVNNLTKGAYDILFYNGGGQFAFRKTISHGGGFATRSIPLPPQLQKRIDSVQLKDGNMLITQLMIVH